MLSRRRRALPRVHVMALRYYERLVSNKSENSTSPSTMEGCRPASAKFSAAAAVAEVVIVDGRARWSVVQMYYPARPARC